MGLINLKPTLSCQLPSHLRLILEVVSQNRLNGGLVVSTGNWSKVKGKSHKNIYKDEQDTQDARKSKI